MNTIIKKYEKKYPMSPHFSFIETIPVPKINALYYEEDKLLLYLLSLKRKYMYIFLNSDPNLKEYEYKKIIKLTKQAFDNFNFFCLDKKTRSKVQNTFYVYIYKKKQKVNPYLETSDNNIFKTILSDTTLSWFSQSLFIKREKKLKLKKSYKNLVNFCENLTSKYKELELNDILLKSGTIFLLYGLRNSTDIDMIITKNNKIKPMDLKSNKEVDIMFLDKDKLKNRYDSFVNLMFEPQNFLYFKGIKITILQMDLKYMRIVRDGHPRAIADYLMVDHLLNEKYPLPGYPKTNKFKKDVQFFIKKKYRVYDYTLNI